MSRSAIPITVGSTTAPAVDLWYGYSAYATSLAPVVFRDGVSTGAVIWATQLTSNGGDHEYFDDPVIVPSGVLYVDSTGTVTGSVLI